MTSAAAWPGERDGAYRLRSGTRAGEQPGVTSQAARAVPRRRPPLASESRRGEAHTAFNHASSRGVAAVCLLRPGPDIPGRVAPWIVSPGTHSGQGFARCNSLSSMQLCSSEAWVFSSPVSSGPSFVMPSASLPHTLDSPLRTGLTSRGREVCGETKNHESLTTCILTRAPRERSVRLVTSFARVWRGWIFRLKDR